MRTITSYKYKTRLGKMGNVAIKNYIQVYKYSRAKTRNITLWNPRHEENPGEVVINNEYCVSLVNLSVQINFSANQSE